MVEHDNPNQWAPRNWPPESLLRQDIREGKSYVCLNDEEKVVGTFFYDFGSDIESTYRQIFEGAWMDDSPYGVVHRIASDRSKPGIGMFCLAWACQQAGHMRIDTHGDNYVMQNLVKKLGFVQRGIIYVKEDSYPRLAFEKLRATGLEPARSPTRT